MGQLLQHALQSRGSPRSMGVELGGLRLDRSVLGAPEAMGAC